MMKWLCTVCNIYIYDEEKGDADTGIIPNTRLFELPDSWRCPVCGASVDKFIQFLEDNKILSDKSQHNINFNTVLVPTTKILFK